jgi:VanZ family protein
MQTILSFANNRFLRWGLALVWTFYLTVLLLQPELKPIIPTGIPSAPPSLEREIEFTIAHLIFFSLTAIFWCRALETELSLTMTLLLAVIFLFSYSFVTELAQSTVPGRTVQIGDVLANITGISIGLALFRRYLWKK